jgi:hypothetical protein
MAKPAGMKGMSGGGQRTGRGRTNIGAVNAQRPTRPNVPEVLRAEVSRPQTPGGGKHRGDRRDTSPTYTGNQRHASRGNTARPDVKTRKR